MRNILLILFAIGSLIACNTPTTSENTQQTQTPASTAATEEQTPATTVQNIGGLLGDDSMFPFVYVDAVNKLRFEAYTMKFTLEHPNILIPLNNTDTPWINPEAYSEFNGQFVTYIRSGREAKLENPYIMVQYINKSLPFCGTIDSVYMWLDSRFLADDVKGEVVNDFFNLDTQSGKEAICREYRTPKTADGRAAKRMGYAYFDYNDDYIIGMNLTSLSEGDFEASKPDFQQLVKSFNIVP